MNERVGTRFSQDDRGAVLPIVALSLAVLMIMTAFSVDIGRQMMRRREAQGSADMIALDLARLVDGRTRAAIESDAAWDQTRRDSAARNNFPDSGVTADLGHWDDNSQTFTSSASGDVPDAVKVIAHDTVQFFFAQVIGISQGSVTRSSVAAQNPTAAGSLGSVGAGFRYYNQPGVGAQYNLAAQMRAQVLNATLDIAFGINGAAGAGAPPAGLNFDALSYQGIANAFVTLGDIATAAGFGSVDELLGASMTTNELLTAEINALKNSSDVADINAGNKLVSLVNHASTTTTARLGDLIHVAQGQEGSAANLEINALDLITGTADIINGEHFFATTINTSIPGAPTVPIRVSVIEPPHFVYGAHEGDTGPDSAQVRVSAAIPTTLDLTPFGVPLVQTTTIPVVFEAASATSLFSKIRCSQPVTNSNTDLRVFTNGLAMHIGSVTDAALQSTSTLTVQAAPLLHGTVTIAPLVSINLDAGTAVSESKTFKNDAVYSGDLATNAGVLGGDETHTFIGNTWENMNPPSWRYDGGVGNTSISTTMFNNLGISNSLLNTALSSALNNSLANLDQLLMDPILSAFGVTIAGADGSIGDVKCGVKLVN